MTLPEPVMEEDVDPKDFIMGDYPVADLVQRGYQQNPRHHWWYSKMLPNYTAVEVQLGGTEKGPYDERGYVVVPWHNKVGIEHEFWTGVAPFKDIGAAVDKVEALLTAFPETHWINDDDADKVKRKELYRALEGLTDETGSFPGGTVVETVTAHDFIMGEGPWIEFKSRMEELGWKFDKTKQVPTIHGTTVEEHIMQLFDESRHRGEAIHIWYTAYIAEFTRDGVQRLSVTADGMSYMFTGKTDVRGDDMFDYVPFGIEFNDGIGSGSYVQSDGSCVQPVEMDGAEFADLMNDEIRARTGPTEYKAPVGWDDEPDFD